MNATALARAAYSGTIAPTAPPRTNEYRAFARVTHRLKSVRTDDPAQFGRLAEALHDNQRLWNLVAVDVAQDRNPLPLQLRAQLFYLAEFTRTHSARILAGKADPQVLVDINTMIMRGLSPDVEQAA